MREKHVLFLMNVIMFIIRVLKLLSMQGKYTALIFVIFFIGIAPVGGTTAKIAAGAPVFIGESDLDISNALNGCHAIGWWKNGTDTSAAPDRNMILYEQNSVSEAIHHYNISPAVFAGYTGSWYCSEKKPLIKVFDVREPQLDIFFWDLDQNQDVSGKNVSFSANMTYRVDTNLYPALNPLYRPYTTPLDSFFTVTLADPYSKNISSIFTGSAGNPKMQILSFVKKPFITSSPFYWTNGKDWDRNARNAQGESLYPAGTYTITISQDLNDMEETYRSSGITNISGTITRTKTVTFVKGIASEFTPVTPQPVITSPDMSKTPGAPVPTSSPVSKKTTYTPLPEVIVLASIGVAGLFITLKKRQK